jgi:hypothetical protein
MHRSLVPLKVSTQVKSRRAIVALEPPHMLEVYMFAVILSAQDPTQVRIALTS